MTMTQWFIFFIIIQVIHFAGTWKLYVKAGKKPWEAIVPVYNAVVLMKIINRPWWWVILLFVPIINLIMFPVIWVETARSFGKNSTLDTWLTILTLGFYLYYINYALDVSYIEKRSLQPRTAVGEWVSSILFAIVAATLVHTYFIQPYVIPTSSLEKTLLVGDFLFVSKFHFGARVPMTTVAAPMVHDTLPLINKKSYLHDNDLAKQKNSLWNKLQLPYMRLPGFQKIKRNDIVVFSWPADNVEKFHTSTKKKIRKPIDKKSNYVKRCVGIPGDELQIKDGKIYINGEKTVLPDRAKPQFTHIVKSKKGVPSRLILEQTEASEFTRKYIGEFRNQNQIAALSPYIRGVVNNDNNGKITFVTDARGIPIKVIKKNNVSVKEISDFEREVNLTEADAEKLRKNSAIDEVTRFIMPKQTTSTSFFPGNSSYNWNLDNFGPIYLPEEGKTIDINIKTLPIYKRIITEYEKNTLQVKGNQILINDEPANTYTFKQDYYWMMGDNRHRSEDSRYWGFVPQDHIVGKPVFIWMSIDGINNGLLNWKIRWSRLFTTVGGSGEPISYFKYFLILIAIWIGYGQYKKRRKTA